MLDQENLNTTQVVEGTAAEPVATETPQATQVTPEPQTTPTTPVESGSKEPQVPEATRRKPSDYYRERQTIRELKDTVATLLKKQSELESANKKTEPVVPDVPDYDPAHFSPDHKRILAAREKALREAYDAKITAIEQRVNGFYENQAAAESQHKYQEALEKLFPKTSPDSKETLEERAKKNPERTARIKDLLAESGLNELSVKDPDRAVKYLLLELGESAEKTPQNPTVLKKTMMGGAPTGNPGMGSKRTPSEQDLLAEKNKLNTQLDADPNLRHDPKFMERRVQVLSELERLVSKK